MSFISINESEVNKMTVCIAAICGDGKKVIVAADRMFTVGAPVNVEFETSERKIEQLAHSCVALSAGNSAYAYEILRNANIALAGRENAPVEDAVKLVNEAQLRGMGCGSCGRWSQRTCSSPNPCHQVASIAQ